MQNSKLQFKIKNFYFLFFVFVFALFIFNVHEAQATTTVYLDVENPTIYEGDTFIVSFKVSTLDEEVNVVDGIILYDSNNLEIKEISTGASALSLWPKPPIFSNDKGQLSFVGGAPEGLKGEAAEILKIIFLAKNRGETKIDFLDDFSVLLNDGKGTRASLWLKPLVLEIATRSPEISAKDEWQDLLTKDQTSPEFVESIISRDPSIFDNKYFVSFFAIDDGTGIAYYEIKEGDRDFVRAETPYLLQDQSLKGIIQIKAVDKAGNEILVTPMTPSSTPEIPYKKYFVWILGILIAFILVFVLWRVFKPASK